jgi:hypothetical protein
MDVFNAWIERVRWVIANNGRYFGETLHGGTLFRVTSSRDRDYTDLSNTLYLWMKDWGVKGIHQELGTFGDSASGASQIKIWFQKFRNSDVSCKDVRRTGQPPLTRGQQLKRFLEKYPFAGARVIAQHFLATVPTIKNIIQKESSWQIPAALGVHPLSSAQKAA